MALEYKILSELIQKRFPDADFQLEDYAGDGDHYELRISSACFQGLTRVMQHKLVHEALSGYVGNEIHALSIKTTAK